MILVLLNRRVRISRKALLFALLLVGLTGIMLYRAGFGTISVIVVLVPLYLAMWLAEKPLPRLIARISYSIRWKFEIAIATVSVLFLSVSLISFGSMESMHQGLHDIQDLMDSQQGLPSASGGALSPSSRSRAREAVDDLEDSRHGTLFSLTPLLGAVGVVAAAVLGAAMAWSVIDPVRAMGHAMRRIALGDFTQPVRVENKDELGELSDHVNTTAQELERLQAATLAEERDHALRDRMVHVTMAEEEERRRISRELHDGLGPSLAAIDNMVRVSQGFVRTQPAKAEEQLGHIAKSIKVHIREIRELIYALRLLVLDQLDLEGAIQQRLELLTQEMGAQASLSMTGEATAEPAAEVTIYRVVQEYLTNVLQHAEASHVRVSVEITPDGAQMHVKDNGRGFDPATVVPAGDGNWVGLLSMQERAERLGGSLSICSRPGSGCQVDMYIPCLRVEIG